MRPTRFLLVTCATLAGCGAPTHERPTAVGMPHFTSEFLAGGWVLAGASCDSDSGVIYRRDGRWIALGGGGTWQVKKGRLVETVVEQEDAAGEMRRLPVPVQYADQVEVIGPDAFIARRGDGSIRQLHRCDRTATR